MAVFKNFKDDELIVNCECGCDEGIHFKIYDYKDGDYAFLTYTITFILSKDRSLRS